MDMEITEETVSRLILGHLHTEKNKTAYNEYLKSCQYFRKSISSCTNRKKRIITRFRGLSLLEVLQEYAAVYNLVQEYLEGVGYFQNHKTASLLDELEYLLSLTGAKFDGNRSRSSTPLRVRSISPVLHSNHYLSPIIETSVIESEVNTTALQDLPGNNTDVISRRKGNSSSRDVSPKNFSKDSSPMEEERDKEDDEVGLNKEQSPVKSTNSTSVDCSLERIQQTILEHPEFQAKIAENINSIINASVHSVQKESTSKAATKAVTELDSTIKMILQKTEEDPLFERLLEDIIGDATSVSAQLNQNIDSTELHTPKKLTSPSGNIVSIKQRLRSSRKSIAGNDTLVVESSNNVIDNIIAAAAVSSGVLTPVTSNVTDFNVVNDGVQSRGMMNAVSATENQNQTGATTSNSLSNAEIILYDGPIDTLFPTSSKSQQTQQTTATPGLLMLQPQGQCQSQTINCQLTPLGGNNTIVQSSTLNGCSSVVSTSCDVARSQQPQPYYMISENGDVISVPTQMIVCTTDAATMVQQQQYVTTATQQQQTIFLPSNGSKYVTQQPQPTNTTLVDLFSTYKPEPYTPPNHSRRRPSKPTEKYPIKRIKTILPMPTYKIDILPIAEEQVVNTVVQTSSEATTEVIVDIKENVSSNPTKLELTPMIVTPEVPIKKSVTPKSGSHVRVLDFNFITPAKEVLEASKLSKKDCNKNGKSVKSLFTTPKCFELKSWDANLRQLAIPSDIPPVKSKPSLTMISLADCVQQPAEVPRLEDVQQLKPQVSTEAKGLDMPVNLDSNLQDTESIEIALLSANENEKSSKKSTNVAKKSPRIRKKSEKATQIENSPSTADAADTLLTLSKPLSHEELSESEPCIVVEDVPEVPQSFSVPLEVVPSFSTPPLTTKSRIKRKCNIDSSIKQEVTVTRVKEIKSLDILTESGAKLILSPSKLANKRSLVTEPTNAVADQTKIIMNMPTLETPIKLNSFNNPQTPNIASPQVTSETPFTKMFNEQMEGVDISAIPTPRLPITPSLNLISPFNIDQSGCCNRPTDYSTSSSYYQPSDSDQNKSLEKQIIEECKRLENGGKKTPNTQTDVLEEMDQNEAEKLEAIATVMKTMKTNIGVGRKNLNLIPKVLSESDESSDESSGRSSSSSSSSSDSESDQSVCQKPVIQNKLRSRTVSPVEIIPGRESQNAEDINAIISTTNFKSELKVLVTEITLTQQEKVLKDLEAKRKRTIAKFKTKDIKIDAPTNKGVVTRSSRGRIIKPVVAKSTPQVPTKSKPKRAKAKTPPTIIETKRITTAKTTKTTNKRKSSIKASNKPSKSNDQTQLNQLDPLDIVETHLSEHSAASTPIAVQEEQVPAKKQTQEESRNILNMILKSAKISKSDMVYKTVKNENNGRLAEVLNKIKAKQDRYDEKGRGGKEKKGGEEPMMVAVPESKVCPDLEAEKLVKGLKQWGIHLVPKAKSNDGKSTTQDKHEDKVPKEEIPECSLNTSDNTGIITFDDRQYTEKDVINITFKSNMAHTRTNKNYDLAVLNRKFTCRVFIEEANKDVDVPMSVCPFESLLELPTEKWPTENCSNSKIQILEEVIVTPKISNSNFNAFKINDERSSSLILDLPKTATDDVLKRPVRKGTDFLSSTVDALPKSITEFQMIKDMQAKLVIPSSSTPKRDDDSLYDFALTGDEKAEAPLSKQPKKRLLNDSTQNQSPKRIKIDPLLQELTVSDKKRSSKSVPSTNNVKGKSDRQLLEKIDVEHFLSVLHP